MSVNNDNLPAMHFTPALRNLALEVGTDLEHHENVAEVARDLFMMKTERNAETKQNIRTEANLIVKDSQRKIIKAYRLEKASLATGPTLTVALSVFSVAIPFLIPAAIASASVATGTLVARSKINVKEEEKKVWVYTNFPEAVRNPHVKKSAYEIFEKEEKALNNLPKLDDPEFYSLDDNGDRTYHHDKYEQVIKAKKNHIFLVKTAETNALKEFIRINFYS
jgi:hypothetical protein